MRVCGIESCGKEHEARGLCVAHYKRARRGMGYKDRPEYSVWNAIRSRCTNPNNKFYGLYGGRGIRLCDRWLSFDDFFADTGQRPSKFHTIDRIDPDGNYEPGNVRWATQKEQQNNRRNNIRITLGEDTRTLAQWCEGLGLQYGTVWARISKYGLPPAEALSIKDFRKV